MAIHHGQARMVVQGVEFQNELSVCGGKWDSDESVNERLLYTVKANEGKRTKLVLSAEIQTALLPCDSVVTIVFMFIRLCLPVNGLETAQNYIHTCIFCTYVRVYFCCVVSSCLCVLLLLVTAENENALIKSKTNYRQISNL